VGTAPAQRGRIREFVRWLARTPWLLFSMGLLQADVIGALLVLGFLRFGLPPTERVKLQDLPTENLAFFLTYVFVAFLVGTAISFALLVPVFRWQRHDALLADEDPALTEQARLRALRMPVYRSLISITLWMVGAAVLIAASWPVARHAAPELAVATLLGATATAIIGYLQSERVLRPVAVAALRGGLPENFRRPGVMLRLVLAWILATGVPLLMIVLSVVATKFSLVEASADAMLTPILLLAVAALVIGFAGTVLSAMAISDPLRQLRWALGEVQRGNYNAHMQIYDATELGGQERDVAVLFIDLVGSTELAATRPPGEVVTVLNDFFRVVVDTVQKHGGFVNKFQGDAALCIFGAPIEHPDAAGAALAASRELHDELVCVLQQTEFGIGVSSGRAIAGHIGAHSRFEYTVIGDPVNEAARLTELAKMEEGHVLASAIAVSGAMDAEALCWNVGEIVELRGRVAPTQLARPLNLAVPSDLPEMSR
jgi:adenylate cyclase